MGAGHDAKPGHLWLLVHHQPFDSFVGQQPFEFNSNQVACGPSALWAQSLLVVHQPFGFAFDTSALLGELWLISRLSRNPIVCGSSALQ